MTDFQQAINSNVAPWRQILREESQYMVIRDAYPVTAGHVLFVPKWNNADCLGLCFQDAVKLGEFLVGTGECDGYNVGINRGESAGQTVMYPHVHLIPRRKGDCDDPAGGVRGVIPGQANYRKSCYQQP